MALFEQAGAASLGPGYLAPAGSVRDAALAKLVAGYKRTIASRYRALVPDELDALPAGNVWVSPKIDGQLWFLVVEGEECALVAPNGKVIGGPLPVLEEARALVVPRARGRLVLAGELFAIRKGGRPRCGDLAQALGAGDVARLGFHAFDLLIGGDADNEGPMPLYSDRLEAIRRLCAGGKRLQAIKTEACASVGRIREFFAEWVEGGKGEGLVVRTEDFGRIYKIKGAFTLDAAVIGFTERSDERSQVRSLLLAVMKENGQFQVVGSCGNLGSGEIRAELHERLSPAAIPSTYSFASSTGALFRFVRPELVVEVKVTDVQAEDSMGQPISRMVLALEEGRWTQVAAMPGVSILHPVLERVRDDKEVCWRDVRAEQILERVFVDDLDDAAERVERAASELIRREVYRKVTKGKVAVRKLLVWKTNKEQDPSWPAYVVHWTDYSPGRKEPLQREVRLAPTAEAATAIAEAMVAAGVKRGWEAV